MVFVNGDFAGQRPYGYSGFNVDADPFLRYGEDNKIRVEARSPPGLPLVHRRRHLPRHLAARRRPGPHRGRRRPDHHAGHRRRARGRRGGDDGRERLDRASARSTVATEIRDADGDVVAAGTAPVTVLPGEPATVAPAALRPRPVAVEPDTPPLYTGDGLA